MAEYYFIDLRKRYIEISKKLHEYNSMGQKLDEKIKKIEDETNERLSAYRDQHDTLADNVIDKKQEYLATSLAYAEEVINDIYNLQLYFDKQISGSNTFQEEGKRRAGVTRIPYSQDIQENINILEQLNVQISSKIAECTRDCGIIGFGKKLAGYNNSVYVDTYYLIYQAYQFFDGLKDHFRTLLSNEHDKMAMDRNQFHDTVCAEADAKVAELDSEYDKEREQWRRGFDQFLDSILPVYYLEDLEQTYNKAVQTSAEMAENQVHRYIPLGKLCFYIGGIKDWTELYHMFEQKYGRFIQNDYICAYAVWNVSESRNFIFANYGQNSRFCDEIESMICKGIKVAPAGDFCFTMCNASGLIDTYKDLSNFIVEFPQISGGRVLTNKSEISEVLEKYIILMDDILQRQLIGYSSFEQFNQKNPNQKIPYRCLCITGFPANFDEAMLERLLRLLKQGDKAGIQILLQYDNKYYQKEAGSTWKNYVNEIMNVEEDFQEKDYFWRNQFYPLIDLVFTRCAFRIENHNLFDEFREKYHKEINKALGLSELLDRQEWFRGFSGDMLKIPIGLNEYGQTQYFEMGDSVANGTSHYAIIAGPTGSGKSTLLHTLIMNCLLSYSPEEVQLYLMDFKEGTEFKIYREKKIPHIRCIALDAMQEFGESILNKLWTILEERNEQFMEVSQRGREIKNISDYRKAGYHMPRILVVLDEFQVLFDRDHNKKAADRAASRMSDFISKGRVYGIHFIFATQTMHKILEGGSAISRATLEEMHIRIGLQCQPKEMELLFGEQNFKECQKKVSAKKGSAIYLENDIVSQPIGMQVAYADPKEQQKLLEEIERHFADREFEPAVVFRGKDECSFPYVDFLQKPDEQTSIYLGEPIGIDDPVRISLSKKKRSNLLAVGEIQPVLNRIGVLWTWQAAMMNKAYGGTAVYLFDGAQMIDEKPLLSERMQEECGNTVRIIDNVFRVIPAVNELYEIFEGRKKRMVQGIKEVQDEQKIHMIVSNYQWIEPMMRLMEKRSVSEFEPERETAEQNTLDGLMSMLNDSGGKKGTGTVQKLHILLESGYLCGIQTLFTCSDFTVVKKVTSADLAPFTNRILLKTVSSAAYMLVDSDINMKNIRQNTALFSDGVNQPYLFKPYILER
ncbi:FtsK/SpoIIIE domain-containing protein [Faecalicatena orotica]|uniref:FtsK/SpoIIIE domain-containing protein n=1 Tax=Faecalicatena orotica TaxID=1544 RepID=UPI0032178831